MNIRPILAADLGEKGSFVLARDVGNGPEIVAVYVWRGWKRGNRKCEREIRDQLVYLCVTWKVGVIAHEQAAFFAHGGRIGASQRWRQEALRWYCAGEPGLRHIEFVEVPRVGPAKAQQAWDLMRQSAADIGLPVVEWDGDAGEDIKDACAQFLKADSVLRERRRMALESLK
ncbi:MAG TPA: hypothetical protein VM537_33810 [Anaerolineae bacterium]|nr:hypothetical protein [Anaerolineae bacterium]